MKAALAAAVACIFFGASVVATRFVVPFTTPLVLAFLRYLIATTFLIILLRQRAWPAMPRRDRWRVAVLGALFFGVFPWSFSASLTYLPSSQVALIVATNPLVTLTLSRWRGVEQLTTRQLIGQGIAFAGLALALPRGDSASGPLADATLWKGYLAIGTTVLSGSIYNVFSRPLLLRHDPLAITVQSMVAGTLLLLPLALAQGIGRHTVTIPWSGWMAVLFLGIPGGAMGFGLWIWALRHSTPSRVAVFLALNPITAITLGVLLLGESLSLRLVGGLVAVLTGIWLATMHAGGRTGGPWPRVRHRPVAG